MNKIKEILIALKEKFPIYDERVEATNDLDSSFFIESMSNADLDQCIEAGKTFFNLADMIREHQRMLTKEFILDPDDKKFKDLDPRSLNFMFEEMYVSDQRLLGSLKQEQAKRDEAIKKQADEAKAKRDAKKKK